MRKFICSHCGRSIICNKRLKHLSQRYCGSADCQRARKHAFERAKYRENDEYRESKKKANRERNSRSGNRSYSSDYQQSYRDSHPEYVERNRMLQRERTRRKATEMATSRNIVNPDALMSQSTDNQRIHVLFEVDTKKIVNPDALMLQQIDILPLVNNKPLLVRLL